MCVCADCIPVIAMLSHQLHDLVVDDTELSDKHKSIICERIGVREQCSCVGILSSSSSSFPQLVDKRLSDGAEEYLQLMDLCSVIMTRLCPAEA